ncbi:MAG TPA: Xaa-Pro peptidase family protein [Bacillales bacterium]|nr:Xaa-Pro peptidase family protein [Bacillales bacterium]
MNDRLNQFSLWLKENDVDFAFITSPSNVFYLTNFHCTPHERLLGLAVFPDAEPFLVCPQMEVSRAREAGWGEEIVSYGDADDPWEKVRSAFEKRSSANGGSTTAAAIEVSVLSYERAAKLREACRGEADLHFRDAEVKIGELRRVKDDREIGVMRDAAKLADEAVAVGVEAIAEGKTEMEIVAEIEYAMKKRGVSQMAFSTMVLTGANAAKPHGTPGRTRIKKGDFVLFDLGVVVDGYCSDITRTVAFGKPNEEQKKVYETVLRAQEAALAAGKPGGRIGDLDKIAREIITDAGYGEYFPHRIGHGLGIEAHEAPSMSENNDGQLQTGMVYTIEPGIYVPDVVGVRIEDDVLVTETGYESLTAYPKELQIIQV